MKNQRIHISREAIRRAGKRMRNNKDYVDNYNGIITLKTMEDGVERVREISWKEINDAYAKALKEYGKKL